MRTPIFFSIVITVYNVEEYLQECIESILRQTYSNIEILLVDDGSTDRSGEVCDEYAIKDERVQVFHQTNQGIVRARINGIQHAKGNYVVFVDSDDWVDADMCSIFAQQIEKNRPDIVAVGLVKEYADRSHAVKNILSTGYYDSEKMKQMIYPQMIYTGRFFERGLEAYICAKAIDKKIITKVAEDMDATITFAEGGVWLYLCMLQASSLTIVDALPYHYRMREDSMSIQKNLNPRIDSIYKSLISGVMKYGEDKNQLIWQLDNMIMYFYIWKKLPTLNYKNKNTLYPYPELKKGSRIILYGAWRFGRELHRYIKNSEFCKIVLWVDQNADIYRDTGLDIQLPEKILETEYDYILLGTMVYSGVQSMKKKLLSMGIEKNILYVKEEWINSDYLPDECKDLKKKYINV